VDAATSRLPKADDLYLPAEVHIRPLIADVRSDLKQTIDPNRIEVCL